MICYYKVIVYNPTVGINPGFIRVVLNIAINSSTLIIHLIFRGCTVSYNLSSIRPSNKHFGQYLHAIHIRGVNRTTRPLFDLSLLCISGLQALLEISTRNSLHSNSRSIRPRRALGQGT